ncbi:MAG: glycine cleavage system aminomethyltransferase GcvT [Spirochaetales bacterium]|nr:glycine cleavage system aminomethyltransferase GcvT [Spirochaetales bacterium]
MDQNKKTIKQSPLADTHKRLGAFMTEFADWSLPLYFSGILDEHLAVRTHAGLFDVSHMGEIEIRGTHALPFLQKLLTIDLETVTPNRCSYALMCYEHGGTVDDCFVYCFSRSRYWLVVNAANVSKDTGWLRDHASRYSVTIRDLSGETAKLDIQGPAAVSIASRSSVFPFTLLERFGMVEVRIAEVPAVVSRSGYTGEDGLEIYFESSHAAKVWDNLIESDERLKPAGLGARDSLRIEACYSLYGHELSEHISPVEAGVGWAVHHRKKEDFIGKKLLLKQKEEGAVKNLCAFVMHDRVVPRGGYEILDRGDRVGWVSSGTYSPCFEKAIGLGFIENRKLSAGDEIEIRGRYKKSVAAVAERPFYKYKGGKT